MKKWRSNTKRATFFIIWGFINKFMGKNLVVFIAIVVGMCLAAQHLRLVADRTPVQAFKICSRYTQILIKRIAFDWAHNIIQQFLFSTFIFIPKETSVSPTIRHLAVWKLMKTRSINIERVCAVGDIFHTIRKLYYAYIWAPDWCDYYVDK